MRARLTAVLLALGAGGPVAADSVSGTSPNVESHVVCAELIESAGFDNRFETLRVVVSLLACDLAEQVSSDDMHRLVRPRLRVYTRHCFDPQERQYLREVLRSGAMRELGHAGAERCRSALERIGTMQIPANVAREALR